jgi:hypothetical protein
MSFRRKQSIPITGLRTHLLRQLDFTMFDAVPDWRSSRGPRQRPSIAGVLWGLLLALLSGRREQRGAEELTGLLSPSLRCRTGIRETISDSTFGRVIAKVPFDALRRVLHHYVKRERALTAPIDGLPSAVAVDGKFLSKLAVLDDPRVQAVHPKHAPAYGLTRVHNATLVCSSFPMCIDLQVIPGTTNEIGAAPEYFEELLETYSKSSLFELVMCDAGNASTTTSKTIDSYGVGYAMRLTEMQGGIWSDGLAALSKAPIVATKELRENGKTVKCRLYLCALEDGVDYGWGHPRIWLRLERESKDNHGNKQVGRRDWVSNVPLKRYSAKQWLELLRRYWLVEEMHKDLDVVWNEDRRRSQWTRTPSGLLAMAILCRLAFNILGAARTLKQLAQLVKTTRKNLQDYVLLALCLHLSIDAEELSADC